MLTLDAQTIAIITGIVLPILVGLITKMNAAPGLKATVLALLSAIGGWAAVAIPGQAYNVRSVLTSVALTWVVAVATYYGLLKPTGVSSLVQTTTQHFGLGADGTP